MRAPVRPAAATKRPAARKTPQVQAGPAPRARSLWPWRRSGNEEPTEGEPWEAELEQVQPDAGVVVVPVEPAEPSRVSAQFADRLAERRRAVRRVRWHTIGLIALAAALVSGGVYLTLFSTLLALDPAEIEVTGANDIVDVGQVRDLASAEEGVPLARINASELADRIESEVIGVLDVDISRQWPTGLQIALTPRIPVATVADQGGYVVLDVDAVQLDVTSERREDVPLVEVDLASDRSAGALHAVVTVLGSLPPSLFDEVVRAGASSADHVELHLQDGSLVIWGSAEENDLKAEVLAVLRQVPAAVYDISAPRNPITRDV